jgi:HEAT repeat protein
MSSSSAVQPVFRDPMAILANGVVLLFIVVVFLSIVVVLHHVITDAHRRRNRLRFESAALTLAPYLVSTSQGLDRAVAETRLRTGDRTVALVLRKIRYDLKGELADRAAAVLNDMGEVSRLLHKAKSRRDWRRLAAMRALGECGGSRVRGALIDAATHDKSDDVRSMAREGLLHDGSPEALQAAVDSFVNGLPRRAGARRSFYTRLTFVSEEQMATLLRSGRLPATEQKLALEAVGDVGRRSAMALAKEHLMSHDAEMRATAVRVIGKVGGEGEMRMAIHALDDREWYVRAAAARSLEWMLTLGGPRSAAAARHSANQRLYLHLTDEAWWVRANSARALTCAGDEGAELLRRATESDDLYARDAAVAAMAMIELLPDAVPAPKGQAEKSVDSDADATIGERTFRPGGLRP